MPILSSSRRWIAQNADALRCSNDTFTDFVPEEIWRQIFVFCIPNPPSFSPAHSPLLLTHVCRTWRRIALSQSVLWAQITLDSNSFTHIDIIKLVKLWMDRAGAQNHLSVDLRFPDNSPIFCRRSKDVETPWYQAVGKVSHMIFSRDQPCQLKRLLGAFPGDDGCFSVHQSSWPASLSNIEDLVMLRRSVESHTCLQLERAPETLRKLTLFNVPIKNPSIGCILPPLTHLELCGLDWFGGPTFIGVYNLLAQTSATLKVASLYMSYGDDGNDTAMPFNDLPVVHLPVLTSLILSLPLGASEDIASVRPNSSPTLLLSKIYAPKLENIAFSGFEDDYDEVMSRSIGRLILEHKSSLRTIALGGARLLPTFFIHVLPSILACVQRPKVAICSEDFLTHIKCRWDVLGPAARCCTVTGFASTSSCQCPESNSLAHLVFSERTWLDEVGLQRLDESEGAEARGWNDIDLADLIITGCDGPRSLHTGMTKFASIGGNITELRN